MFIEARFTFSRVITLGGQTRTIPVLSKLARVKWITHLPFEIEWRSARVWWRSRGSSVDKKRWGPTAEMVYPRIFQLLCNLCFGIVLPFYGVRVASPRSLSKGNRIRSGASTYINTALYTMRIACVCYGIAPLPPPPPPCNTF